MFSEKKGKSKPEQCPLCKKFVGDNTGQMMLDSGTIICSRCWHLEQEARIQTMRDIPPSILWLMATVVMLRRQLSIRYWLIRYDERKRGMK
jgi:hypothetical protein